MASSEPMDYQYGGFDYQFVGNVQDFLCRLCGKVMRDPTQTSCGHLYCRSCLDIYTQKQEKCRVCFEKIDPKSGFPDANIRNRIVALKVKCPNVRCTWEGYMSQIETHVFNCELKSEWRKLNCEICGEMVEASQLPQHKEICSKRGIKIHCLYNCGAIFTLAEQEKHETTCPTMPRSCPYEKCTMFGILSVLNMHLTTEAIQHAVYHKEQFESFRKQLTDISLEQDNLRNENRALKKQLMALQQSHYSTKMKLSSFIRRKEPPLPDESWDYFREMVSIPTNSVLIWEISDFKSVFMRANRQTKIYSPPFYTSPVGFKLCCYAQRGDDQIIRVSIQRMEGKFDDILGVFGLQSIQILILNQRQSNNQVHDFPFEQPIVQPTIGPLELSSFQNILAFIGESNSAFLEVHVS